jgi:hypothetical protein
MELALVDGDRFLGALVRYNFERFGLYLLGMELSDEKAGAVSVRRDGRPQWTDNSPTF